MAYEGKGVWCVGEVRHGDLSPSLFELITAGRIIADARSETLTAVLIGKGVAAKADEVAARGADKILVLEHDALDQLVDEAHTGALTAAAGTEKPRTLLFSASVYGRSVAPRVAVALGGAVASDASALTVTDGKLTLERSAFGSAVISTVAVNAADGPEVVTTAPMAFERSGTSETKAEVTQAAVDPASWTQNTEFVSFSADESKEIDLGGAEKIVSGGRGLGNADNFSLIRDLAKSLGAAVGASRAVVDSGWIPYKHQVGLTGRQVRPRLYVACGISGQIQHLAGMKSSDVIVAINTDADCPMMKLATYSVKGDLTQIIPAIVSEIDKVRGSSNGS
ncbi:MAG: electron transfer flavoprotein subunit alpha [Elusimicrobia bacterium]|nr:MAG: electron transfer flavoprotein subunit alpha [Elusimicrobiota bacterium]